MKNNNYIDRDVDRDVDIEILDWKKKTTDFWTVTTEKTQKLNNQKKERKKEEKTHLDTLGSRKNRIDVLCRIIILT